MIQNAFVIKLIKRAIEYILNHKNPIIDQVL